MSRISSVWLRRIAFIAVFAGSLPGLAADPAVEVIPLRFRTAEQILPLIQPLVAKSGTLSGQGREILLRTTRVNASEIRKAIEVLDRPPRSLLVTVRQDAAAAEAGARSFGTRAADSDLGSQSVRVADGAEASIRIGQSVPVTLRGTNRRTADGRIVERVAETVEFRDIIAGFTVRPRLAGDGVVLDLAPQRDLPGRDGAGSMDVQRIVTTFSGRLGEWIEVGAVNAAGQAAGSAVTYGTRSASVPARRILVKVETID